MILNTLATKYVHVPVSGDQDPTGTTPELAFLAAGLEPSEIDWHAGDWQTAGAPYVARLLVGPDGDLELPVGEYKGWVRFTIGAEHIVEIAEGSLTVESASAPSPDSGAFATIEQLAEFIRLPVDTIDEDAATAVLRGASDLVRQELGQHIDYVADDVVTLKSPGGKLLLLPELPVIDVTVVRWRRPGGDYVTLVEGTDYEVELGRAAKIWRTGSGALGFFGESSSEWPRANGRGLSGFIEVTYSHGYDVTGGAEYSDAEPVPDLMVTVVKRVAARGYQNPEAVSQETTGRGSVVYGQGLGLYLSNDDKRDLDHFRPGGPAGSR